METWDGGMGGLPLRSLSSTMTWESRGLDDIAMHTMSTAEDDAYAEELDSISGYHTAATSHDDYDDDPQETPIRGQQIHEDIDTGNQTCDICLDSIERAHRIWYCQECWHVFHYKCMADAANGRAPSVASREMAVVATNRVWKCPSCRTEYAGQPWELCCR